MSFAIIHRDIEWEWVDKGGVFGYYIYIWRIMHISEDVYICFSSGDDEQNNLLFKNMKNEKFVDMEQRGAYELYSAKIVERMRRPIFFLHNYNSFGASWSK